MLMSLHETRTVRLRDGRHLGFTEYGYPAGQTVFFFHGIFSSRLHAEHYHDVAWDVGVRLVSFDRPGYGLSDFQPNRRLLDWPNDVCTIAKNLGIRKFAVLGHSAGGPHAAACAAACPELVTGAALVSSPAPPVMSNRMQDMPWRIRLTFQIFHRLPWLSRFILMMQSEGLLRCPESTLEKMISSFPASDASLMRRDERFADSFVGATLESFRRGVNGSVHDARLHQRPWGFRLNEISVPVQFWYGEEDFIVPAGMGRYLAQQTNNGILRIEPESGHLSTLHNNMEEILTRLVS